MGATMSSAASPSGAAAAASSSSSAAHATHYYFCHGCFLATTRSTTTLRATAVCPLCYDTFVEEINIPPSKAPRPNPNLGLFFATSCLSASPASFVLRGRSEADAFFYSPISPLRHLRGLFTGRLPDPLAHLEVRIDHLLAHGTSGACVYVVLAGVLAPHYIVPSIERIGRLAHRFDCYGGYHDTFFSMPAKWVVDVLRNIEIDAGPEGGQSCVVCLETLEIGTAATRFPCSHVFHRRCIVRWLRQQHNCPICRFSPLKEEMIEPSHSVFRVVIPPLSLGLNLDKNIVVLEEKVKGDPVIPPRRWA